MKMLVVFATLLVAALAADKDFCYKDIREACSNPIENPLKCSANYGDIKEVLPDLQKYVSTHITRSFEYLLMSTHFGNYKENREGFEKLFHELSDSKWEKAIDLIKYITKRGGEMNFEERAEKDSVYDEGEKFQFYEVESLAKALDVEKQLAVEAHRIHKKASGEDFHDPEVSSYLENEFVHKHASCIRKLSGHTSDLIDLLSGSDSSLALYLFDELLQQQSIV